MKYLFFLLIPFLGYTQVCIVAPYDLQRPDPLSAFGLTRIMHQKDTHYVYFMDFDYEKKLQKRILYRANRWRQKSKIRFIQTYDVNKSDVRITLAEGGSWSYVGMGNKYIPKTEPTMQLGWALRRKNDLKELDRVVIHEFGHYLGLLHEHQHPHNFVKWNRELIYQEYLKYGWTREQVNINLFAKYGKDESNYTEYDPESIMHYPVPKEHTLDGYSVGWNRKLSELDKKWINKYYVRAK